MLPTYKFQRNYPIINILSLNIHIHAQIIIKMLELMSYTQSTGSSVCGHKKLNQTNILGPKHILFPFRFYLKTFSKLLDWYSIDCWV